MNRPLLHALAAIALLLCTSPALGQADACPSDLDGDGIVAGADLALVLGSWGPCKNCDGDVNGDHLVDGVDLAFVLTRWGGTCAPTTTSLSAAAGPLAGGVPVTVQGDHLLNPTGVTFGGSPASVVASTRTSVTVIAPARPEGAATVVINTQGGAVSAGSFAYYGAPTITAVTPNVGYAGGGQTVMVTGSGFYEAPSVRFGTSIAPSVALVSTTQMAVVVPPGAAGSSVSLSVSTPSGSGILPAAFSYTVVVPPWATILEAAPDPTIVTSESLRNAIILTGLAWRVRDASTQIEMVLIPPGTYAMGCSASNANGCLNDEYPVHQVNLTNPFYLGRYEVTQAQWAERIAVNPSYFQASNGFANSANRPVDRVTLSNCSGFLTATGMRLPTEAEWEFACRAGTTTAFHGSPGSPSGTNDDGVVGSIAWFVSNSGGQTRTVGGKAANGFGLHDMAGNVAEWVFGAYIGYTAEVQTNPVFPPPGSCCYAVLRGGSWNHSELSLRSSARMYGYGGGGYHSSLAGFRVARNP